MSGLGAVPTNDQPDVVERIDKTLLTPRNLWAVQANRAYNRENRASITEAPILFAEAKALIESQAAEITRLRSAVEAYVQRVLTVIEQLTSGAFA